MKKIIICLFALFILTYNLYSYSLTQAIVSRVIDGDTIVLADGQRVRLTGIDAPEVGQPNADEVTQFVRDRVLGRTVWLEADGNDRDRFGRLRRYVWLKYPANSRDGNQIRRYMLNALLLSHGHADVMIIGNVRNEALFRQIASER